MKKKAGPFKVLLAGMAWRTFGSGEAGATLLEAMSGDDEQQRMLAGMSLVKAGDRTIGLIEQTLGKGRATPPLVRLLGDLGGPRALAMLEEIASGSPEDLAKAAGESLDLLERIAALGPEEPGG